MYVILSYRFRFICSRTLEPCIHFNKTKCAFCGLLLEGHFIEIIIIYVISSTFWIYVQHNTPLEMNFKKCFLNCPFKVMLLYIINNMYNIMNTSGPDELLQLCKVSNIEFTNL